MFYAVVINVRQPTEVWQLLSLETALKIHEKGIIITETVLD